jgi:hypothetical protein
MFGIFLKNFQLSQIFAAAEGTANVGTDPFLRDV